MHLEPIATQLIFESSDSKLTPVVLIKSSNCLATVHHSGTTTPDGRFEFHAIPGENTKVPIWLHRSGTYSAQLAGQLGLPFAFAGHFAPNDMMQALKTYRDHFRPSDIFDQPYL